MAFLAISTDGVPTYTIKQGVNLTDLTDERPTVVTQSDADRLNVISSSNAWRTTVVVADAISVADSASMTAQVITIPNDIQEGHLYFDSTDQAATFTFTTRITSTGSDYTYPSLLNITLTTQREGHIISNLSGVHYLVINYANSSGSTNTLTISFIHASSQQQ
jgi:hypothetical protein